MTPRPYCVALTGGIGSGKSLVASIFARLGAEAVDTDIIARELTAPGGEALSMIAESLGRECFLPDGSLDRRRLREKIFSDPAARGRLEAILHPLIHARAERRVAESKAPYVILVIPLLFESGVAYRELIDRILVVDCEPEQQIERIMHRDGIDRALADSMIAAQVDRTSRLKGADDVLDNRAEIAAMEAAVLGLHKKYLHNARLERPQHSPKHCIR